MDGTRVQSSSRSIFRHSTTGDSVITHISSTQFLEFIGKNNCLILFEKAVPAGKLKREMITLATADGRAVGLEKPTGFRAGLVELPRPIFDDFLAASFIEQDRPEDEDGRIFFRLTADGKARALS